MAMMGAVVNENVAKLESLLPVLKEKEAKGLILPSYAKAQDLVRWAKSGRVLSEKQELFVGRLILRAERQHKKARVEVTTNVVNNVDIDDVAAKVLAKIGEKSVDTEKVVSIVLEKLERRAPRKVEIEIKRADGKVSKAKGPTHRMFEHLARAASIRMPDGFAPNIFLQGEASSGKTTGCRQLAETLGVDWHFNGAISFPHEMLGFIDGAGKYHTTPFRKAFEGGGIYTFDEVDRSDPVALLAVNPHLANGVGSFPDKQVKRHKDCVIICTANTWGHGADANYSGATKLDAAFISRFSVRLNWDIDEQLEEAVVGAGPWLQRVRAARARARAAGLRVMIDTRAAQAGAALIACGLTPEDAANQTYLANLKPEQRRLVEG